MPLPEAIPVRYTEEEAGYVSLRPVVRQTFGLDDLLDMILSVTGKDPGRIRRILRSGTVVYHHYRYWWEGFDAGEEELRQRLRGFPDADPSRPFRADRCVAVRLETGAPPAPPAWELDRAAASRARWLRRRTLWDALLDAAARGPLEYHGYSYESRADLYRLALDEPARAALVAEAGLLAPRDLRRDLRALDRAAQIVFICPRAPAE